MFGFIKRLLGCEEISAAAIRHSSKGEYTTTNRLKSGGHGQEAIDYMQKKNIAYSIIKVYSNGVRVGYVPDHVNRKKRSGLNQSWFPKEWNGSTIKRAGQYVAKGKKYDNGITKTKVYKNVRVGIKRTNGKVATIFPLSDQTRSIKHGKQRIAKKTGRRTYGRQRRG